MSHPQTAEQMNAAHVGTLKMYPASQRRTIPIEPLKCGDGFSFEFHIWKRGAKEGDKCLCGKRKYVDISE